MVNASDRGTPKTIHEAIKNALIHSDVILMGDCEADSLAHEIIPHVRDFFAQRFSAAVLKDESDETMKLWNEIFPKE